MLFWGTRNRTGKACCLSSQSPAAGRANHQRPQLTGVWSLEFGVCGFGLGFGHCCVDKTSHRWVSTGRRLRSRGTPTKTYLDLPVVCLRRLVVDTTDHRHTKSRGHHARESGSNRTRVGCRNHNTDLLTLAGVWCSKNVKCHHTPEQIICLFQGVNL